MRRLEDAGITSIDALRACSLEGFAKIGVRKVLAEQILMFLRRR